MCRWGLTTRSTGCWKCTARAKRRKCPSVKFGKARSEERRHACRRSAELGRKLESSEKTLYAFRRKHVPAVSFAKQLNRNSHRAASFIEESNSRKSLEEDAQPDRNVSTKPCGLISMDKQLSRNKTITSNSVPEYNLNYSLVLPRVPMKVDYKREIKYHKYKFKRRLPLMKPFLPKVSSNRSPSIHY